MCYKRALSSAYLLDTPFLLLRTCRHFSYRTSASSVQSRPCTYLSRASTPPRGSLRRRETRRSPLKPTLLPAASHAAHSPLPQLISRHCVEGRCAALVPPDGTGGRGGWSGRPAGKGSTETSALLPLRSINWFHESEYDVQSVDSMLISVSRLCLQIICVDQGHVEAVACSGALLAACVGSDVQARPRAVHNLPLLPFFRTRNPDPVQAGASRCVTSALQLHCCANSTPLRRSGTLSAANVPSSSVTIARP